MRNRGTELLRGGKGKGNERTSLVKRVKRQPSKVSVFSLIMPLAKGLAVWRLRKIRSDAKHVRISLREISLRPILSAVGAFARRPATSSNRSSLLWFRERIVGRRASPQPPSSSTTIIIVSGISLAFLYTSAGIRKTAVSPQPLRFAIVTSVNRRTPALSLYHYWGLIGAY